MALTGMITVARHIVGACQNDPPPPSSETTCVMQANWLKESEVGEHSLRMRGKTTKRNRDLGWAGQRTQGQEVGMYKDCLAHSGAAAWLIQCLDVGMTEACSPLIPLPHAALISHIDTWGIQLDIARKLCVIVQKRSCDFLIRTPHTVFIRRHHQTQKVWTQDHPFSSGQDSPWRFLSRDVLGD